MAPQIAVATTTWYDSPTPRSELALKTIRAATELGYPVSVVDGGSFPEFRTEVQKSGLVTLQNEEPRGMGPSRRQTLRKGDELAGKDGATAWTEPEKESVVEQIAIIAQPVLKGEADLAIMNRKNLDTYPPEQAHAEHVGNLAVKYITGLELDFWSGVFVANHRAIQYFLDYKGEYGDRWDSITIPRLRVLAAGLRVVGVEVDYVHPPEQTQYETGNLYFLERRIEQLQNLVPALVQEAKKLGLIPKN